MTNERRFRPLTRTELEARGLTVKPGSKYLDVSTGQIITRRQRENLRVEPLGYKNYAEYQRQNYYTRRESDRLYQTFQHILSTKAPGIPIPELRSNRSSEGRELRRLYDETDRAFKRGDESAFENGYNKLLEYLDLPNPKVNQDWEEIWERYKGSVPMAAL